MKIVKFNFPTLKQLYFKVVLDGKLCDSSTDVSVTSSLFTKLASEVDFSKECHDLVHIEVNGDSEVILQSIYTVYCSLQKTMCQEFDFDCKLCQECLI